VLRPFGTEVKIINARPQNGGGAILVMLSDGEEEIS
jgi:hypothetical protein